MNYKVQFKSYDPVANATKVSIKQDYPYRVFEASPFMLNKRFWISAKGSSLHFLSLVSWTHSSVIYLLRQ